MFKSSDEVALIDQVSQDQQVVLYRSLVLSEVKRYSWFRRVILDPILKPLLEKLFKEYAEVVLRAAIAILIKQGKL